MNYCPVCGSNEINTSGYCWQHQNRAFVYCEKLKKEIVISKELYERLIYALENWLQPCDCDMGSWHKDLTEKIKALRTISN